MLIMPIPNYQQLMLPLLKVLADKKEYKTKDAIEKLSVEFNLSDEEKFALLDGGQPIFNNRVGWARTYLKKAGLIDNPKRGTLSITTKGSKTLLQNPQKIDVNFLKQFPEFIEFVSPSHNENGGSIILSERTEQTPEEILDAAYSEIRASLASELLSKVVSMPPVFFEKLVVELLVKMGYGGSIKDAGKAIGKTGDEGIDGTIKEDKLGLDTIYIQAKRWQPGNVVGRPELHKFVGALAGQGAKKGVFITTSSFTKEALEYSPKNDTKIILIDGKGLMQYMIDYNIGVTSQKIYDLKRMDIDYFGED
jgi:restriction system protein